MKADTRTHSEADRRQDTAIIPHPDFDLTNPRTQRLVLILFLLELAACGGGGGPVASGNPPPPLPTEVQEGDDDEPSPDVDPAVTVAKDPNSKDINELDSLEDEQPEDLEEQPTEDDPAVKPTENPDEDPDPGNVEDDQPRQPNTPTAEVNKPSEAINPAKVIEPVGTNVPEGTKKNSQPKSDDDGQTPPVEDLKDIPRLLEQTVDKAPGNQSLSPNHDVDLSLVHSSNDRPPVFTHDAPAAVREDVDTGETADDAKIIYTAKATPDVEDDVVVYSLAENKGLDPVRGK